MSTPVPNHNGWTAARQQTFLEALADTGSVAMACRRAGMSRTAAYRLRRHPDAADFRAAWDVALVEALHQIEHVAIERALHGEEEVIEKSGFTEVIRRRPCDARLLVRLLDRAADRLAAERGLAEQLAALRAVIDALPDRRNWLPDLPDPVALDGLDRLSPPLRLISPDPGRLEHISSRTRVRKNA
jgi:hypothetical protein